MWVLSSSNFRVRLITYRILLRIDSLVWRGSFLKGSLLNIFLLNITVKNRSNGIELLEKNARIPDHVRASQLVGVDNVSSRLLRHLCWQPRSQGLSWTTWLDWLLILISQSIYKEICGVVFTKKNVGWSESCQRMCLPRFCGHFSSRIMSRMPLTPF